MNKSTAGLIADGLVNVAANLGTDRDKASFTSYFIDNLDPAALLNAYRSSWLAKAIVDIPALDSVRKWRDWQAEADQITAIDAEEKRLNLRVSIFRGMVHARLFGGAAIYIGTGHSNPSEPLRPEQIKKQGLRGLTVLSPQQIAPDQISHDIESGYYGRPEFYTINGKNGVERVHASRLVVLIGDQIPDGMIFGSTGWGDSVLQSTLAAVKHADSTIANVASLVFEAKIDVFRFQGVMDRLADGGDADAQLVRRLRAMATIKGVNGAIVLDKEDEYEQKSASFSALSDIIDRFFLNVAGAARMPVTRLFGRSAAGLSGSGDGDERVYFDRIGAMQELEIQPAMQVLDECLIQSAIGSRPPEVFYTWSPLRQITEQERANIFKTTAEAARALAGSLAGELLPIDALSDALANELVEQGVLPGLEAKIEEYGALSEQDDDEVDAAALGATSVSPDVPPAREE